MTTIGFVGLGHMGQPMAENLLKSGYALTVYDVAPVAVAALVAGGARAADSLAALAAEADIIVTMLQTGAQVNTVCLAAEGLFHHAKPNTIYIDSSSIEIDITQTLHQVALEKKLYMLDAPVSGGVAGAVAGTLTFMVGGAEATFLQAKPILEKMGKKIILAGSAGHGQAAKICNNLILGISMIAVSEGFSLAEKLGLDLKKFFEISSNASGQCWAMTSYCPVPGIIEKAPSNQNYQPGFMSKMMLKDLRLGEQAALRVGATLPLANQATALYARFVESGLGRWIFRRLSPCWLSRVDRQWRSIYRLNMTRG